MIQIKAIIFYSIKVARLYFRQPTSVHSWRGKWQFVDADGDVYIYSAFYDARPHLDWPQVRITAVAEIDVDVYNLCCLVWYPSQRPPDVAQTNIVRVGAKILPKGQRMLEQYIFSCRLDRNNTDMLISVSLAAPRNFRVTNLLPVQVPEQPKRVIEFGLCMKIMY